MFAFRPQDISHSIPFLMDCFDFSSIYWNPGISNFDFYLGLGLVVLMDLFHLWMKEQPIHEFLEKRHFLFRWIFYFVCISAILYLAIPEQMQFIYFEF
jgi:hypothetical protein